MSDTKEVQLQLQLDEDVAQGMYANLVLVSQGETEFTLDFVFVQPQQPRAKVRSRVLLNPLQAKRLALVLQQNVQAWEQNFGRLEVGVTPGGLQ